MVPLSGGGRTAARVRFFAESGRLVAGRADARAARNRGGKSLALIGRLKPGRSAADAEQDLAHIAADIARDFPQTNAGWTVRVISLREQLVGSLRPALVALLTAVGVVLLIACANVANLLLVRAAARQREICVRYALGASRSKRRRAVAHREPDPGGWRRQWPAWRIAWWMLRALLAMAPASLPGGHAGADSTGASSRLPPALSLVTALAFGAVPAWHCTRYDTAEGLREGARGTVGGRNATRTRNVLVVLEVALAVILLHWLGAPGPDVRPVDSREHRLPHRSDPDDGNRAAEDGVPAGARVGVFPVARRAAVGAIRRGGRGVDLRRAAERQRESPARHHRGTTAAEPGQEIISDYRVITAGYFEALAIPLLEGDPIQPPPEDSLRVWINQTMARSGWPGQSAIGRRMKLTNYERDGRWYTVAGIVGDTRYTGLDRALRPQVYVHYRQDPRDQMAVVLRSFGDPVALVNSARAAVQALDPNQPIARVRTMEQIVTTSVANRRFQMLLIGVFALLAVTLAVVGLYAVVSYSVAERIHEMGLRLALGARPSNLLGLVLREGLRLVGLGIAIGVGAALLLTRFLETLLFGVRARE